MTASRKTAKTELKTAQSTSKAGHLEKKPFILETERLSLREMKQEDFPDLCKHLQDVEVMYAWEHAFCDDEVSAWLDKQLKSYQEQGFGSWAVILKENDELIGQCGLLVQQYKNEEILEIVYIFQKDYWHQGYATEAASACRQYAFTKLGVDEVYSIVRDTNIAAQNVAKRNGMTICDTTIKHYYDMNMPHYLFVVRRFGDLTTNIDRLNTTPLGLKRIKNNIDIPDDDVVAWCKDAIKQADLIMGLGKNWYVYKSGIVITINAFSYTIITAHRINAKVRVMEKSDYECLPEFLYQALFIPEGMEAPKRSVIGIPEISIYIEKFGTQASDLGVVVEQNGQIVGAAWVRIITAYGHIDDETPELAISIFPEFRGYGIGFKLMEKLFVLLRQNGYTKTSLSVQNDNPAVRFYRRLGYQVLSERIDHGDYLMVKNL